MDKFYIVEWPEAQKWSDMWHKDNSLNIRLLDDQAVAVECNLYDRIATIEAIPQPQGRTKSRRQIFDQYFRVLNLITDRDKGLSTKTMRGRADRILAALYRYKDKLESAQRYKELYRLYEKKLLSWDDLQEYTIYKRRIFHFINHF